MQLRNRDIDRSPPRSRNSRRGSMNLQPGSLANPIHDRSTSSNRPTYPELSTTLQTSIQIDDEQDVPTVEKQQNSNITPSENHVIFNDCSLADLGAYMLCNYECQGPDPNISGSITPFAPGTRAWSEHKNAIMPRHRVTKRGQEALRRGKDNLAEQLSSQTGPSTYLNKTQMPSLQYSSVRSSPEVRSDHLASHLESTSSYDPDVNRFSATAAMDVPFQKADASPPEERSSSDVRLENLIAQGIAKYIASQPIYLKWNIRAAINTYFEQNPIKDIVEQAVDTYIFATGGDAFSQLSHDDHDRATKTKSEVSQEASRLRRTKCDPPFPDAADYGVFAPVKCKPTVCPEISSPDLSIAQPLFGNMDLQDNTIYSRPDDATVSRTDTHNSNETFNAQFSFARPRTGNTADDEISPKHQKSAPPAAWPRHLGSGKKVTKPHKAPGFGVPKQMKSHEYKHRPANLFRYYDHNNRHDGDGGESNLGVDPRYNSSEASQSQSLSTPVSVPEPLPFISPMPTNRLCFPSTTTATTTTTKQHHYGYNNNNNNFASFLTPTSHSPPPPLSNDNTSPTLTDRLALADRTLSTSHRRIRSQLARDTINPRTALDQIVQTRRATRAKKAKLRLDAKRRVKG